MSDNKNLSDEAEPTGSAHKVTFLSGGRPGENYTAQCSCGKWFESTHNTYRQRAVKLHLNKASKAGPCG